MKTRLFVFLFLSVPFLMWGQGFEAIFGSPLNDFGERVFKVPNENAYITINVISSPQQAELQTGITKLDNLGNIIWEKTFDISLGVYDEYDFALENNGFRFASPYYDFNTGDYSIKINKLNFDGDLVSEQEYDLPEFAEAKRARFFPDLSVLVIVDNLLDGNTKLYKLSSSGSLIWAKTYPSSQIYAGITEFLGILPNGGSMAITLDGNTFDAAVVTKFTAAGNIEWQKQLPNSFDLFEAYMIPFPNGDGYFVWGIDDNFPYGTYTAKLDNDGQIAWSQNLNSYVDEVYAEGVVQGNTNSLYVVGTLSDVNESHISLLELDGNGNVLFEKQYNQFSRRYRAAQLKKTNDDGLLIAVESYESGQFYNTDPYVMKTDMDGEMLWSWVGIRTGSYNLAKTAVAEDGGYFVLGYVTDDANNQGPFDNSLVKLTANGNFYAHQIVGQLAYDENLSCTNDSGEPLLSGWKISAAGTQTTYATTPPDGNFRLFTNSDTVTVDVLPPNEVWAATCTLPALAIFGTNDTLNMALYAQATENCPVLEVDVATPFLRRCFTNTYYLTCKNTGTVAAENLQLTVLLDSFFIFQNASLPVAAQNGNELVFNIGNLGLNESITFTIQVEVSCDAEIGQIHCISLTATADNECDNTSREFSATTECQPNVGSFDPNDKRAFTEGALTDRFIPADSIIEYQIRFQNTGTDTAFNVVVIDTLSSLLDIESIHAGASSHPYHLELERNNILKFIFEDIMLPDSNVNEPASHGFVKFRIRHMPVLVAGDVIPNKAAIFFDFNEAVITNNLELEIEAPSSVRPEKAPSGLLKIYPQPAGDWVMFEIAGNRECNDCHLEILTTLGQTLYNQPVKEGANAVSNLPKGHHFYLLWENGAMVETGKLIIIK